MAQNKEHLNKLLVFIEQLIAVPGNEDFAEGLSKLIQKKFPQNSNLSSQKIDDIYDYCIEQKLKEQAKDFYYKFPTSLYPKEKLEEDYVRMEKFRFKNNFSDFSLATYQQIEAIINSLCKDSILSEIVKKMWEVPAYVDSKDDNKRIYDKSIAMHIVGQAKDEKTGMYKYEQFKGGEISSLWVLAKLRLVVYFFVYKAKLRYNEKEHFEEFVNNLFQIYECRNLNHRGGDFTTRQKDIVDEIISHKTYYSFCFLGTLAKLVDSITEGYNNLQNLKIYSEKFVPKILEATITRKLPSCCFVSVNGDNIQLPQNLIGLIKNKKEGDIINVEIINDAINSLR